MSLFHRKIIIYILNSAISNFGRMLRCKQIVYSLFFLQNSMCYRLLEEKTEAIILYVVIFMTPTTKQGTLSRAEECYFCQVLFGHLRQNQNYLGIFV